MKDFIFVTCLYFQIMLVQCDIFVNDLNGSNAPIKKCIQKTINHLFSENDTLNLILNDNNLCEDAIFEIITMRPYIVLNMNAIHDVNKLQYDGQFIICPKDVRSLNREIHSVRHIAVINKRKLGNSKILVITNTINVSKLFSMFWFYDINNVIILVYGQGTSELLTCDRFAPENKCARTAKLIIRQNCEEHLSLSFTSVIHQMNKCPLTFWFLENDIVYQDENFSTTRAVDYIFKELSHNLNATFQRTMIRNSKEYDYLSANKGMIVIGAVAGNIVSNHDVTEPFNIGDALWFVPKAKQISSMNVCLKIFTYHVWMATIVVFICVWLMWFLIISRNGGFTFDKLCISFLNVWSLTIFGNVAQLPRPTSLSLRIVLLFYLFYAINMQFAFTSDMSTFLTAPQYGFQIQNLEELIDSQLPVYGLGDVKEFYFSENMTDRKLYTKLQNLIHVVTDDDAQNISDLLALHLYENYAFVAFSGAVRELEIFLNRRIEAYKIIDRSITPIYNNRLSIAIDHYFKTTLNTFVSRMIECGINEKHKNDFYNEHDFLVEKVDTTPQDDLITLKHLSFIFVFFGFGLGTACVVFCFELVLHKYL